MVIQIDSLPGDFSRLNRKLSVAPMLDLTDRHCRYFHRLLTRHALLYTEMITAHALLHGERQRLLRFDQVERPLALQLGGCNPEELALCAEMAEEYGYDEVNLNVGCPSDRVLNGRFGACLMAEPQLVADCVAAMLDKVSIPITVKSRIGIDELDSYPLLRQFVSVVASAQCKTFIIHARKAWLNGLSPKQNREIPPLRYDWVHRLKRDFPQLEIILNGGITQLDQVVDQLQWVDGVMIGREAYHNPYLLAQADERIFHDPRRTKSRTEIVLALLPYIQRQLEEGTRLHSMTRHILGLFHGQPGARRWRRSLSENAVKQNATQEVVLQALALLED